MTEKVSNWLRSWSHDSTDGPFEEYKGKDRDEYEYDDDEYDNMGDVILTIDTQRRGDDGDEWTRSRGSPVTRGSPVRARDRYEEGVYEGIYEGITLLIFYV